MCDAHARCVGMSTVPMRNAATVTGMIGVHGSVSGFITVSMSETVAMSTVSGLLQEQQSRLTSQVVDGVGEIANIIAGGIKKGLAKSSWAFTHVTVPSVIIGQNYHIAYARGLEYFSAAFEYEKDEILTARRPPDAGGDVADPAVKRRPKSRVDVTPLWRGMRRDCIANSAATASPQRPAIRLHSPGRKVRLGW